MTANSERPTQGACRHVLAALLVFLVQCAPLQTQAQADGTDAEVQELVPAIYWIGVKESRRIGARVLDMINAVRTLRYHAPLTYAPQLNYAAFIHARDLNEQQKTWNFSSAGASPVLRVTDAGYEGTVLGENVVQTFDPPLVVIHGMLRDQRARDNILNASARDLGLGWYQNDEGRTWWVLIIGR